MPGHVNMMDDVLISQLPPAILKSSIRALVSQGSSAQKIFVEHVRGRLRASPPALLSSKELFGQPPLYGEYLASTRCLFSSRMAIESLPYISHFLKAIPLGHAFWTSNDDLELALEQASGDIVQAIQALKESRPPLTSELKDRLFDLRAAIEQCEQYSTSNNLSFPFYRARLQVEDATHLLFHDSKLDQVRRNGCNSVSTIEDPVISARVEQVQLGPLRVPRIFNGLWQMSSPAWGAAAVHNQKVDIEQLRRVGFVAADMADHYGDAELFYGAFRNHLPPQISDTVIASTKWCVFQPLDKPVTPEFVLESVMERSRRLGGRVELLQFHWYDYAAKDYLVILNELVNVTKSHPHVVTSIGLCNFDSDHTNEACEYLQQKTGEVGIVSNQIQYSLIDSRPSLKMEDVCQKFDIKLLTYGSLCGGFLSDSWLGKEAPDIYSEQAQLTPSQRKYFDMIHNWGSWEDFQTLLRTLNTIGRNHGVDISNVATRWVLDRPAVGVVILGARLGISNNSESNIRTLSLRLKDEDVEQLDSFALGERARTLFGKIGDCGDEYRSR